MRARDQAAAAAAAPTKPHLYSGRLRPFPGIPDKWPSAKQAAACDVLDDVREAFPGMLGEIQDGADIEDFWEDACRISAAWRATGGNLEAKVPGSLFSPWNAEEMARRLGPIAREEMSGRHAADALINHPLVGEHGGRAMLLGSVDGEDDVIPWLAARHRDHGVSHGVVKAAATKRGIWMIKLDGDPSVVRTRLVKAMDWTFVRLEGLEGALLAQDALDLQWEYRLFVVDGELVTGAGCVEEFTPLDRSPGTGPFDTRVLRNRGHLRGNGPSAVEDRPDIVARLLEFGAAAAGQHGGTVVIDVAIDAGADKPVIVELNELPNSGLYASDPRRMSGALIGARDRGYPRGRSQPPTSPGERRQRRAVPCMWSP